MLDAMTSITPANLSPYYYRDNFLRLCESVEGQYGDLLSESEQHFLQTIRQVPFEAQCLYVRLVSRSANWFRESQLNYQELGDTAGALDDLLEAGLLACATQLSLEDAAKLFTVAELRAGFASHIHAAGQASGQAHSRTLRKSDLLNLLETLALPATEVARALQSCDPGRWVTPVSQAHVALLQLLFFGNRYQSLTDFILQDIGVVTYYPYALSRERRLFPNRAALDEHILCLALMDEYYARLQADDSAGLLELAALALQQRLAHASSMKRWSALCNRLGRELERRQAPTLALALYEQSHRHPARERRARILEQQGEHAAALQLCQDMLAAPWCEAEVDNATRIAARLQRKLGAAAVKRPVDTFDELRLQLAPCALSVESLVAHHLGPDWHCVRVVENRLMNTLFALAFWEQIFAPLPGAFSHPYQSIPHDMYSADFYTSRKAMLEQRIDELATGDLTAILVSAYHQYHNYQCRWLHPRAVDAQLVADACTAIPAQDLIAIWRRMLFDPKENRRGLPDLLALGTRAGDYCMIEVKAPGDRLQDHQKRWLRFFQRQGIPAQVAWVEWRDPDDD